MTSVLTPKHFDELEFGDEVEFRPDVSMHRVKSFGKATGMKAARFSDHVKARKEGLPSAIVPGIMSQGLLAAALNSWVIDGRIVSVDTVFRAPLQVDSQPVCRIVITDRDVEARTLELDLTIVNEDDQTRVLGTATVRCE